jgi:two-component system sensor histidine kinase KdpD
LAIDWSFPANGAAVRLRIPRVFVWLIWLSLLVLVTIVLVAVRGRLDQAHVALIYLLLVLGASASGGRSLGFFLSFACSLLIDYYLQTPYDTLAVGKPLDWFVLVAFLITASVAAQLLGRANAQAEAAQRRAAEIDRLAALGAETLKEGRAEDALTAIARVLGDTLRTPLCAIYACDPGRGTDLRRVGIAGAAPAIEPAAEELVLWVGTQRHPAALRSDGSSARGPAAVEEVTRASAAPIVALILPLLVHERLVGALLLANRHGLRLDRGERRVLEALAYYAALGVERMRLAAEAEHAEVLREADRMKDALLASVSHDLRTPLTAIKALASDIAIDGDERAGVIVEQANRLNQLVADLLDLSRLSAGGVQLQDEVNAAEDLVGAAIQQLAPTLAGRELKTSISWSDPMVLGRFDFVHSLRILVNLVENALKYSPREQPVEIGVAQRGEMLEIAVSDRGPGVPAAERQRIFQPFYRPAGVSPDAGGSGLGLAIARGLAEAQGGCVVYEDRPGGGAIFTLRLPAAAVQLEGELSA